ncbi:AzlD domain-containing protein [Anaerococcus sp. AGMB00486]|uniref:AzlD domain-containing protein n=2 Tax=Anaerococcus TaxID=165779 RepID=A0ABX2NBQ8_9FIRM|nr:MULTISPECIES: AzlD domain-containing protein [Anaerococcus]MDY3006287.1 AzlD domain-containing protein [Anaerococcus porci]MSS78046.1 hypothetical protein [Anaerococcus porci]NVF11907.1 AzlD domain-containing protein [Anaerococcus faecalis]
MQNFIKILITASLVTFVIRAVPFFLLKNKEVPDIIDYLGEYLPASIMGLLVVYALKDTNLSSPFYGIPEIIASIVVILLHLWKKNLLLSIAAGTFVYMFLIQTVFI